MFHLHADFKCVLVLLQVPLAHCINCMRCFCLSIHILKLGRYLFSSLSLHPISAHSDMIGVYGVFSPNFKRVVQTHRNEKCNFPTAMCDSDPIPSCNARVFVVSVCLCVLFACLPLAISLRSRKFALLHPVLSISEPLTFLKLLSGACL